MVNSFCVSGYALDWHRSPDSARAFLVLRVRGAGAGNPELSRLLRLCNGMVTGVGQPKLYADMGAETSAVVDAFHISVAWTLDGHLDELKRQATAVFSDHEAVAGIKVSINSVKVKIGNVVTNIPLGNRKRLGRSLFGI